MQAYRAFAKYCIVAGFVQCTMQKMLNLAHIFAKLLNFIVMLSLPGITFVKEFTELFAWMSSIGALTESEECWNFHRPHARCPEDLFKNFGGLFYLPSATFTLSSVYWELLFLECSPSYLNGYSWHTSAKRRPSQFSLMLRVGCPWDVFKMPSFTYCCSCTELLMCSDVCHCVPHEAALL